MLFGSLLQETLKKNKISVTRFADSVGLNRVGVYSVFSGKKKISEETFAAILNNFNFSPEEETELNRAFRLSNFSREKLELMEFIKDELAFIGKSPDCILPERTPLNLSNDSALLSSNADYCSAIEAFLKLESENEPGVVYTNYSFFDEAADKIVFDFVNRKDCPLSVRHTIVRGTKNNLKERLRNGFASIKFARLGHYIDIAEPDEPGFAFPVHFVGKTAAVMFDPKTGNGFFTTNDSVAKAYYISAAKYDSTRQPFNRFVDNLLDLKNITQPLLISTRLSLTTLLPICYIIDSQIIDETLKKDIPHREVILNTFCNHLVVLSQISSPRVFCKGAIKNFAETGKAFEVPSVFYDCLSVKNRKKALLGLKKELLRKNSKIFVFDDNSIKIDEIIEVLNFENGTMVMFVVNKPGCDFCGSGSFTVKSKSFLSLLDDFYDYLIVNNLLLSKEEVEKAFDEGIAICDEMLAKGIE